MQNFDCQVDQYLFQNFVLKYKRSIFGQLRMGVLKLAIETGRYHRILLEDLIGSICNANKIEDEFHFVSNCGTYKFNRERSFETIS